MREQVLNTLFQSTKQGTKKRSGDKVKRVLCLLVAIIVHKANTWTNQTMVLLTQIPSTPFSAPGSHQLVFILYYLALSFLLLYSSSGLSTDVFFLIKRI